MMLQVAELQVAELQVAKLLRFQRATCKVQRFLLTVMFNNESCGGHQVVGDVINGFSNLQRATCNSFSSPTCNVQLSPLTLSLTQADYGAGDYGR